jgi:ribonuclease D
MSELTDSSLPLYEGIRLDDVHLVQSMADADVALATLMATDALGFDTESKPMLAAESQRT